MTTVHAMTASQPTVDGSSKKDWRGDRAAWATSLQQQCRKTRVLKRMSGIRVLCWTQEHDPRKAHGDVSLSDGVIEYAKTHEEVKGAFLTFPKDADQIYPG